MQSWKIPQNSKETFDDRVLFYSDCCLVCNCNKKFFIAGCFAHLCKIIKFLTRFLTTVFRLHAFWDFLYFFRNVEENQTFKVRNKNFYVYFYFDTFWYDICFCGKELMTLFLNSVKYFAQYYLGQSIQEWTK